MSFFRSSDQFAFCGFQPFRVLLLICTASIVIVYHVHLLYTIVLANTSLVCVCLIANEFAGGLVVSGRMLVRKWNWDSICIHNHTAVFVLGKFVIVVYTKESTMSK